jgi:hypothetical protein
MQRALAVMGKADSFERENPRSFAPTNFHNELQESLGALVGSERILVKAFIGRCLYKLRDTKLSPEIQRTQIWRLLATRSPEAYVAIFSIIRDDKFNVHDDCVKDAAFVLASHSNPFCHTLAGKVAATVTEISTSRITKYKEPIIKGLATGTSIGLAARNSATLATLWEAKNITGTDAQQIIEEKSSSYLALARKLLHPQCSPALHQELFRELGRHRDVLYFFSEYPLCVSPFTYCPPFHLPICLMRLLCIGLKSPNPKTQRAAVRATFCSFGNGDGVEGYFISKILAGDLGGHEARREASEFVKGLPKKGQKTIKGRYKRCRVRQ